MPNEPKDKSKAIDLEKVDVKNLPPELQEIYNSMLRDYRAKTEAIANEKKAWETEKQSWVDKETKYSQDLKAWEDWYQELVSAYQQQNAPRGNPQQQQNAGAPGMDNLFDQLSDDPMAKAVQQQYQQIMEFGKTLQERLDKLEENFTVKGQKDDATTNLMAQVFDLRLANQNNPDFDVQQVIKTAQEYGITDLNKAARLTYLDNEIQGKIEEQMKQFKEDWEKTHPTTPSPEIGTGTGTMTSVFKGTSEPVTRDQAKEAALSEIVSKYGG